ncbi:hypothetical protein CONCODRAFT_9262 [Conidiobolus coronatus NRRL 28638]|uniref:G-protein coupled receptors family 1 profile domain-containing protein n=1 Tax=Conidiobolus coronatus (strain ATCC 28846 / CBS 209.66 / NRRL 28638) TaxID=796925 RepID=A0A137P057_CONC2|nr:hypothetical protein CONCODRAFT_9262 [Conidiobolus coronatus NRRL 28638]|eukprot:KXN68463.1 hypothetical protein CONCODRAFT_9262 [Conidiobolus coronatus NRRL 28638]
MNQDFYELRAKAYPYNLILSGIIILISACALIICFLMITVILRRGWNILDYSAKLVVITIVFDLLEAATSFVIAIFSLSNNNSIINSRIGCQAEYMILFMTCITSVNLTGIVSLDRYLLIVKGIRLEPKYVYIILGLFGIVNVSSCIVAQYLDGIGILPATVVCMLIYDTFGGLLSQGLVVISISISTGMIYCFYIKIMIHRVNQLTEISELFPGNCKSVFYQKKMTIIKASCLIGASTIANVPYCILSIIGIFEPWFFTPLIDTEIDTFGAFTQTNTAPCEGL